MPTSLSRILGLFCVLATAAPSRAEEAIRVGEYASLTGKEATFGESAHEGIVMAFEEMDASGGVLGRKVELLTEDNQTVQGQSATAVRKLIARDHVVALLGEVSSGRSLEAAPIAEAARIPMIAPAATNPKVTEVGRYIFRVCFIDPYQGKVMANFVAKELKAKRAGILSSVSNAYSVGLSKVVTAEFKADGGTIAIEQKYSEGDKDFRAQLTAIRAANCDVVFVPGYYTEAALIVRQARELGMNMPFMGGDGWVSSELLQIGGDALNGCYYSTHFAPENSSPAVRAFVEKFKARWNGEVPDAFAALGYDAAGMLADAIRRAGTTDEPALRDALAATKDYPGVTGATTMDARRNATKPATIIAIRDGKLTFLETVAL